MLSFPFPVSVAATWGTARCFGSRPSIPKWSFAAAHVTPLSPLRRLTAATTSANVSGGITQRQDTQEEITERVCFSMLQRGCERLPTPKDGSQTKQTQKKIDVSLCTVSFFKITGSFFSVTSIKTSVVYHSLSREPLPVLHGPVCGQEPTL